MKKVLYVLLGLLVLLLLAVALVPVLFKDQIKARVDAELANAVNADVYYDARDFRLSLFRRFPNLSVGLRDFGVVGRDLFLGDTLVSVQNFEVTVNLFSLFGDKIIVNGIVLDEPRIFAEVLSDGRASWDIAIADTTGADTTVAGEPTEFAVQIKNWEINNGEVIYTDATLPMYAHLMGLDHRGSGDFTQDVFDLTTRTDVAYVVVEYDTVKYLNGVRFRGDVTLEMNLPQSRYTFKDNQFRLNEFAFGFDGTVAMPAEAIDLDLTFAARETEFKNVLSLVPGVYTADYDRLRTSGSLAFEGFAKGAYSDSLQTLPAFGLKLLVNDGMFQYPDLPKTVSDVQVDMEVNSPGDLSQLLVDLRRFDLKLGDDPVRARARVQGLDPYELDAEVDARLNLGELTQAFPLEGTALRGLFSLTATAKGTYSDSLQQLPAIRADMRLQNGYVKSDDFPAALENVAMRAEVVGEGSMASTRFNMPELNLTLDGETFTGRAYVENFDDMAYDVAFKGLIDLEKMTKIFPLEGMTLRGRIQADIEAKGKMSDVEAERYDQLANSGSAFIRDLEFASADVPQGVRITRADFNFDPQRMQVSDYQGFLGRSDVQLDGFVANYMGYLFRENQTLRGRLDFRSRQFDVNEWMTSDTTATTTDTASAPMEVVEIPRNVDFTLAANIGQVLYDNLQLDNLSGNVVVRDGTVRLDGLSFGTLGGTIGMNGTYDPRNLAEPRFDFDLDMRDLGIRESFAAFNTVQALAPVAGKMAGTFSTQFKLAGQLDQAMAPVLSTLTGGGLIRILQATLENFTLANKINGVTRLNAPTSLSFRDVRIQAQVREGRAFFDPFDLPLGSNTTLTMGGSQGLDGTLDYTARLDVPTGQVGAAVTSALSSFLGGGNVPSANRMQLNLGVGGTHDDPQVRVLGVGTDGTGEGGVRGAITDRVDDVRQQATDEAERLRQEAEERIRQEAARAQQEAEERARAEAERIRREAEERARREAEEARQRLRDRLPSFPR